MCTLSFSPFTTWNHPSNCSRPTATVVSASLDRCSWQDWWRKWWEHNRCGRFQESLNEYKVDGGWACIKPRGCELNTLERDAIEESGWQEMQWDVGEGRIKISGKLKRNKVAERDEGRQPFSDKTSGISLDTMSLLENTEKLKRQLVEADRSKNFHSFSEAA